MPSTGHRASGANPGAIFKVCWPPGGGGGERWGTFSDRSFTGPKSDRLGSKNSGPPFQTPGGEEEGWGLDTPPPPPCFLLQINNRAESQVCIHALKVAPRHVPLQLCVDSQPVTAGVTLWLPGLIRQEWKTK